MQTSNFPNYIPLYGKEDGIKWEKPISKRKQTTEDAETYDVVFSQSERSKELRYRKVIEFYEKHFEKMGWKKEGPAGGPHMNVQFIKGKEKCRIVYTAYNIEGDGPDNPVDPKGIKIMLWYKKRVK